MIDFRCMEEDSHLLKQYLVKHKAIRMDEMKYSIRVKASFNSAIERQVAEAVSNDFEKRKGKIIMNSRSEYNQCSLPRIRFGDHKDEDEDSETEEVRLVNAEIKEMKRRRREKKMKRFAEEDAKRYNRNSKQLRKWKVHSREIEIRGYEEES